MVDKKLLDKLYGPPPEGNPPCGRCGLARYEHIDHMHLHGATGCPFGDCGAYVPRKDKTVADNEKIDRLNERLDSLTKEVQHLAMSVNVIGETTMSLAMAILQMQVALLGDAAIGRELLEAEGIPIPNFIDLVQDTPGAENARSLFGSERREPLRG